MRVPPPRGFYRCLGRPLGWRLEAHVLMAHFEGKKGILCSRNFSRLFFFPRRDVTLSLSLSLSRGPERGRPSRGISRPRAHPSTHLIGSSTLLSSLPQRLRSRRRGGGLPPNLPPRVPDQETRKSGGEEEEEEEQRRETTPARSYSSPALRRSLPRLLRSASGRLAFSLSRRPTGEQLGEQLPDLASFRERVIISRELNRCFCFKSRAHFCGLLLCWVQMWI